MWSANGMRSVSAMTLPHAPDIGPKPKQDRVWLFYPVKVTGLDQVELAQGDLLRMGSLLGW